MEDSLQILSNKIRKIYLLPTYIYNLCIQYIYIHKHRFLKTLPRFDVFIAAISLIIKSLKLVDNNKNKFLMK